MPKISAEKKREYNKIHREKKKREKEEMKNDQHVTFADPIITEPVENEPIIEETQQEEETYTIDKETMDYLLECIHKKPKEETKEEIKEETKETQKNDTGFFFHMKQAIMQQLAVTVPLIALKLIVDGAKLSMPLNIQNIIKASSHTVEKQSEQSELRVVNLE